MVICILVILVIIIVLTFVVLVIVYFTVGNFWNSGNKYLAADVKYGLGNQLFQICSAYGLARKYSYTPVISLKHYNKSPHSSIDYLTTIFSKLEKVDIDPWKRIDTDSYREVPDSIFPRSSRNVLLDGYLQNYNHFKDTDVLSLLNIRVKPKEQYFIHVRYCYDPSFPSPGKYPDFYKRALELFPENASFVVVSNDTTKVRSLFAGRNFSYFEGNEIEALEEMASSSLGGIFCYSTLGWFGAYLNPNRNKRVVSADIYDYNATDFSGFKFPQLTMIPV